MKTRIPSKVLFMQSMAIWMMNNVKVLNDEGKKIKNLPKVDPLDFHPAFG